MREYIARRMWSERCIQRQASDEDKEAFARFPGIFFFFNWSLEKTDEKKVQLRHENTELRDETTLIRWKKLIPIIFMPFDPSETSFSIRNSTKIEIHQALDHNCDAIPQT